MKDDFYTKLNDRYINIYSTGNEAERSRKKRLGDIFNKDYEGTNPCNKAVEDIFKKITELYYEKKENK
jgi:hypothetical protein